MPSERYQHLRLEGTKDALIVFLLGPKIVTVEDVQKVGRELLAAADTAIAIDMPVILSFQGVAFISSALVGKIVLLNKKLHTVGISLSLVDMSTDVAEVFRRTFPGDGPDGSMALL